VPAGGRPDPVGLLQDQDATREPDLVPVRHGRMQASPFTFYRGAAKIMAADLDRTPTAGLQVQLCGDAHLSNFGAFASPERRLLFDLNDFDETLPGPFEYDVKRMAASFTIAAQNNGFAKADTKAATRASVAAYREAMAGFARMGTLAIWYAHLDEDELMRGIREATAQASKAGKGKKATKDAKAATRAKKTAEKTVAKARTRDSLQALSKLGELVDGRYRIVSQPPIVVPARDLEGTYGLSREEIEGGVREQFRAYRATLRDDQRQLLEQFQIVDMARKVVGWAASAPGPSLPCCRAATRPIRCSCRSRRRRPRCWRIICPGAATSSTASGWSGVSGCCRRPATSSWAGPGVGRTTATSTGGSCGT